MMDVLFCAGILVAIGFDVLRRHISPPACVEVCDDNYHGPLCPVIAQHNEGCICPEHQRRARMCKIMGWETYTDFFK